MENGENEIQGEGTEKEIKKEKSKKNIQFSCELDPQWLRTIIERCNELCGERLMN